MLGGVGTELVADGGRGSKELDKKDVSPFQAERSSAASPIGRQVRTLKALPLISLDYFV